MMIKTWQQKCALIRSELLFRATARKKNFLVSKIHFDHNATIKKRIPEGIIEATGRSRGSIQFSLRHRVHFSIYTSIPHSSELNDLFHFVTTMERKRAQIENSLTSHSRGSHHTSASFRVSRKKDKYPFFQSRFP